MTDLGALQKDEHHDLDTLEEKLTPLPAFSYPKQMGPFTLKRMHKTNKLDVFFYRTRTTGKHPSQSYVVQDTPPDRIKSWITDTEKDAQ